MVPHTIAAAKTVCHRVQHVSPAPSSAIDQPCSTDGRRHAIAAFSEAFAPHWGNCNFWAGLSSGWPRRYLSVMLCSCSMRSTWSLRRRRATVFQICGGGYVLYQPACWEAWPPGPHSS
jgi:hypothetical protein